MIDEKRCTAKKIVHRKVKLRKKYLKKVRFNTSETEMFLCRHKNLYNLLGTTAL